MANKKAVSCPLEVTLRIIDGRWKVMVIHELMDGVRRFGELTKALVGVSHRTLTQHLPFPMYDFHGRRYEVNRPIRLFLHFFSQVTVHEPKWTRKRAPCWEANSAASVARSDGVAITRTKCPSFSSRICR